MASFDLQQAELLLEDEGNLVVIYKVAMLQVRTGPLTLEILEFLVSSGRLSKMRRRARLVGLVSVLEESAEVPNGALRQRQIEVIKPVVSQDGCSMVGIIGATGIKGTLLRTAVRMTKLGLPNIAFFGSTNAAASWLSPRLGDLGVAELAEYIDWGRDRMRKPLAERSPMRRSGLA